jgi:ferredoxin-NADP reductase
MPAKTFHTRLKEKIPRAADIVTFRFERPHGYDYRAGQWFAITIPRPEGPYDHHFSHSSSPSEPFLELTTRLRGSEFKNVLAALPEESEAEIEGPYGSFTLQEERERVAFLAGGIGITCVRSILRWLTDTQSSPSHEPLRAASPCASPRQRVLLFANRSEADIPFRDELDQIAAALGGFQVVHILSRAEHGWQGYRGHIDEEIIAKELPELQSWAYYLSGPPSFVEAMRKVLEGLEIGAGSITIERFEGYE